MNVAEWASALNRQVAWAKSRKLLAIEECRELVKDTAKATLGHPQPAKGPFSQWKPLAQSTKDWKASKGYVYNPDFNPLLNTGELRESIQAQSDLTGFVVGSDSEIAEWQEFGTRRIPPRPFIEPALYTLKPVIAEKIAAAILGTVPENA